MEIIPQKRHSNILIQINRKCEDYLKITFLSYSIISKHRIHTNDKKIKQEIAKNNEAQIKQMF